MPNSVIEDSEIIVKGSPDVKLEIKDELFSTKRE